jgi:hypothetical protein
MEARIPHADFDRDEIDRPGRLGHLIENAAAAFLNTVHRSLPHLRTDGRAASRGRSQPANRRQATPARGVTAPAS